MDHAPAIVDLFPAFAPNSAGGPEARSALTVSTINALAPRLRELLAASGRPLAVVQNVKSFPSEADLKAAEALKALLDRHGSDKASVHNYHLLYAHILGEPDRVGAILEVGLGSNDTTVVSNMGPAGRPGASLRAFRDWCPNASIRGADVDRGILFQEDRIATFFVDQTDPATFEALGRQLPPAFDLIIDDGLHSPDANLATLTFALPRVKPGGWVVIEDIAPALLPLWECIAALMPAEFESRIFRARGGLLFAARRL